MKFDVELSTNEINKLEKLGVFIHYSRELAVKYSPGHHEIDDQLLNVDPCMKLNIWKELEKGSSSQTLRITSPFKTISFLATK